MIGGYERNQFADSLSRALVRGVTPLSGFWLLLKRSLVRTWCYSESARHIQVLMF